MSQETATLKYYEDEGFTLLIQQFGDKLLVHCDVRIWKPSVLKTIYRVFNTLCEEAKSMGIGSLAAITQNVRFTSLFNGKETESIYVSGKEFKVVQWDLK